VDSLDHPVTPGLTFDKKSHTYRLDGTVLPSVSEAIRDVGLVDYSGIDQDVLDRKARLGTLVHLACEKFDKGTIKEEGIPGDVSPYYEAYKKFRKDSDFKPRLVEQRMVINLSGLKVGATLDREGWMAGSPVVLDLKCSVEIKRWVGVQLAAYAIGAKQYPCPPREPYKRVALQLKKDGTYKVHIFESITDEKAFAWSVGLWYWKKEANIKDERDKFLE
jgi:hypothetical protein